VVPAQTLAQHGNKQPKIAQLMFRLLVNCHDSSTTHMTFKKTDGTLVLDNAIVAFLVGPDLHKWDPELMIYTNIES